MTRLLLAGGASSVMLGVGLIFPAFVEWLGLGTVGRDGVVVVCVAAVLVLGGLTAIVFGLRGWRDVAMPAPVRAVVIGNILFLAFCALETSDGLLRQDGRTFYWTSVLFVPALVLHGGVILGQRWAWWAARGMAGLFVLWFVGFLAVIPFASLRGSDGPTPWWGRLYMMGLTLVFASIAAYAFRALGRTETREYFGMSGEAKPGTAPATGGA